MSTQRLSRAAIFLAGSVVGGLAFAFVIVFLKPDLLQTRSASTPPAAMTTPPAPSVSSFAGAVERAAPAVANIYSERRVRERLPPASLAELFGDAMPRYRQRVEQTLGSGVVVDDAAHIVTNHHVIENADVVRVQLADGRQSEARVVGRDPDTDLAVLSVDLRDVPVMPLGRSDELRVGDVVLAIGNPIGLTQSVTQGIVSGTGRGQLGVANFENFIQTDAPINFGNSGGALINTSGELVGINTAVFGKNLGVEGIGFAIPVNLVRGVVKDILENGRVIRGWIGVALEDIGAEDAKALGLPQPGVVITNLYRGGPAQQAGLRPGDVVVGIEDGDVRSRQEVLTRIATQKPGERLPLRVLRGTESIAAEVLVVERPPLPLGPTG
jgi:serine peptidase DegS